MGGVLEWWVGMVGCLRGETGFVDAVVDVVVCPFVCLVNRLSQIFGQEIHFLEFLGQ